MAIDPSVVINIAAEYTGKKAFNQADNATQKLTKGVKKLAGAVGIAFSATAIVNFGRLAVKASLQQQAEQNRLNQLLKVGVGATTQEIALLNEQAKALERIGVVSGGNITQTQSQLATFNLQVSTIQALTPAILDYVTAEKGATASTADFKSMTNGLAQALNGNFGSLTRVGFVLDENTKKQIKSGTETERANALVKVLNSTYKDFNKNLRATDAGQMQVLANSAQEATTIIGTGLLDALKAVGKDNSIENLALSMEGAALASADFIRGLGKIASFEISGDAKSLIGLLSTPFMRSFSAGPLGTITRMGAASRRGADVSAQKNPIQAGSYLNTQKKITTLTKEQSKAQSKILADKKLALAIDKANLALAKGTDVFDIDKIQLNAALIGQAEALGKATTGSQILAIANDIQRLKVKQSISELEDAIASKDTVAIEKATAKLNEDLKILGALQKQDAKLLDINRVLAGMKSTDLINLANLQAALDLLAKFKFPTLTLPGYVDTTNQPSPFVGQPKLDKLTGNESIEAILEYSDAVTTLATVMADTLDAQNYADFLSLVEFQKKLGDFGGYSANMNTGAGYGAGNVTVTVVDKTSGLIEVVQTAVQENNRFGNNLNFAGAI